MPGGKSLTIVDGRPNSRFTEQEVEAALERHAQAAGPIAAQVRLRVEEAWEGIRADLNAVAGGQASPRVMVLAHHAMRAHHALELQSLAAESAFGRETEIAEKHMRNQAGLSIVATDALNKAYEAAREEGKANKGGLTGQLLNRIGVASPGSTETQGSEVTQASAPASTPGGGVALGPSSFPSQSAQSPSSPSRKGKP